MPASKEKHDLARTLTPALLHALNHPVRRHILRALSAPEMELSPSDISKALGTHLSNLSYHARTLSEQDVLCCTQEIQVRGSTQHFYVSNVAGNRLVNAILAEIEKDDQPETT